MDNTYYNRVGQQNCLWCESMKHNLGVAGNIECACKEKKWSARLGSVSTFRKLSQTLCGDFRLNETVRDAIDTKVIE